jgi:hypothetical protein
MKRGTILVGTTKGGEYDRAYVTIIGFIDPESGKFVKLGGGVLGGDGAAGLKGKSRAALPEKSKQSYTECHLRCARSLCRSWNNSARFSTRWSYEIDTNRASIPGD